MLVALLESVGFRLRVLKPLESRPFFLCFILLVASLSQTKWADWPSGLLSTLTVQYGALWQFIVRFLKSAVLFYQPVWPLAPLAQFSDSTECKGCKRPSYQQI